MKKEFKYSPKDFKTLEDFQKFVDENNIQNRTDFDNRFPEIINRASRLKIASSLIYKNPLRENLSYYNTVEDFQKFINENNIQNAKDFEERFLKVFNRAGNLRMCSKLIYPATLCRDYSFLNTIEDFQKFVDENNIQNVTDWQSKKDIRGVYVRLKRLGLAKSVIYPNQIMTFLSSFNTIEDFQKFVDENNIQNVTDWRNRGKGIYKVYRKLSRLGLTEQIVYPRVLSRNLSCYNTIEDFQKFVDENNIQNVSDFVKIDEGVYRRACSFDYCDKIKYSKPKASSGEREVKKILQNLKIDYTYDKSFKTILKDRRRTDFRIDKYKIIIEYQGIQHFIDADYFGRTFEEQYSLDKKKYDDLINAGYTVLYAAFYGEADSYLQTNSYFAPIYTTEEALKNKLLELIG